MKILIVLLFTAALAHAEDSNETTITIKNSGTVLKALKYEIHDGTEEISGDSNVLKKAAEQNWKNACAGWTKEFKEQNKDRIVSFSCGKMKCTKEGVESTCTSLAKYKLRVLTEQSGN